MKSSTSVLAQLKLKREKNISSTLSWSEEDFNEMLSTYNTAKEIAIESEDQEAVAILDEKISQLEEALSLKKQNRDINL